MAGSGVVSMKRGAVLLLGAVACVSVVFAADDLRLGLPELPTIANQMHVSGSAEKTALGRKLFFDARLSADGTVSCASCHKPELAFTDGKALPEGVRGAKGSRNTPTLANVAFLPDLFWDGRETTLEAQAKAPFFNPLEHGLRDEAALLGKIRRDAQYGAAFGEVYRVTAEAIAFEHVIEAIAAFVRTLTFGDSAFDRYQYGGDEGALSEPARRGLALFRGKAQCASCHVIGTDAALFTDHRFHRLSVGLARIQARLAELTVKVARARPEDRDAMVLGDPAIAELGRFVVTRKPSDIGRFRTPSLRNVAVTAPYMHDGSVATLEDAVTYEITYRRDKHPMLLTQQEKSDLLAFLRSLTSRQFEPLLHQ